MPHLRCAVDDEQDSYMSGSARHAGSGNTSTDTSVGHSEKGRYDRFVGYGAAL